MPDGKDPNERLPSDRALAKAFANAEAALDAVLEIMARPDRNSAVRLAAARLVLETAGVTERAKDKMLGVVLATLRTELAPNAYADVVHALARNANHA